VSQHVRLSVRDHAPVLHRSRLRRQRHVICNVTIRDVRRAQTFEAEAEDNSSRPSPRPRTKFWPRGQLVIEDLTSLVTIIRHQSLQGDPKQCAANFRPHCRQILTEFHFSFTGTYCGKFVMEWLKHNITPMTQTKCKYQIKSNQTHSTKGPRVHLLTAVL